MEYYCTMSRNCHLVFTSERAWLKHDISPYVHRPLDLDHYFCNQPIEGQERCCETGFRTQADFISHWDNLHHTRGRVDPLNFMGGPTVGKWFWCGFCRRMIPVDTRAGHTWYSHSCNHVKSHFEGNFPVPGSRPGIVSEWTYLRGLDFWRFCRMFCKA